MRPNQMFNNLLRHGIDNTPPPDPTSTLWLWRTSQYGNFNQDVTGHFSLATNVNTYPITNNGLLVANSGAVSFKDTTAVGGSRSITIFAVCSGSPKIYYTYDDNQNDTGPGGAGNYNLGQFVIGESGGRTYASVAWNYNGTYPTTDGPVTYGIDCGTAGTTYSVYRVRGTASVNSWTGLLEVRINGVNKTSSTASGILLTSTWSGDSWCSVGYPTGIGSASEILIYKSVLTNAQCSDVETYLKNKWNISY